MVKDGTRDKQMQYVQSQRTSMIGFEQIEEQHFDVLEESMPSPSEGLKEGPSCLPNVQLTTHSLNFVNWTNGISSVLRSNKM